MGKNLFVLLNLCLFCFVGYAACYGAEWVFYNSTKTTHGWSREDFYDKESMTKMADGIIEVATKMVFYGSSIRESTAPTSYTSLVEMNCKEKQYKSKDYTHSDGNWKDIASSENMIALYHSACLGIDRSAEKLKPSDSTGEAEALLEQSLVSFQKKDWNGVIDATTRALILNPKSEIAYTNRAAAYANKGMLKEALSDCNNAIAINPDFGLAYNNRGYVYELLVQLKQAMSDYKTGCGLGDTLACANVERLASPNR